MGGGKRKRDERVHGRTCVHVRWPGAPRCGLLAKKDGTHGWLCPDHYEEVSRGAKKRDDAGNAKVGG